MHAYSRKRTHKQAHALVHLARPSARDGGFDSLSSLPVRIRHPITTPYGPIARWLSWGSRMVLATIAVATHAYDAWLCLPKSMLAL